MIDCVDDERAVEFFWSKVIKGDGVGCWMWTGYVNAKGYGQLCVPGTRGRRKVPAHRFSYELLVGPIPEGLHIDHLCRVPGCVRPNHLEPVSRGENNMRGYGPWATNARKKRCPRGHPYDKVDHRGARACSNCERLQRRERDRRRRIRLGMTPRRALDVRAS